MNTKGIQKEYKRNTKGIQKEYKWIERTNRTEEYKGVIQKEYKRNTKGIQKEYKTNTKDCEWTTKAIEMVYNVLKIY